MKPCTYARALRYLNTCRGHAPCPGEFHCSRPPSCPDRLDGLLRQSFGGHLGSEALVIVGQTDEVHLQTFGAIGVAGANNGVHHRR
jgi:hypothetical protein